MRSANWSPAPPARSGSAAKPIDDDAKFTTDLDAKQHGYDRNRACAEEGTELAERKHPAAQQKSSRGGAKKPDENGTFGGKSGWQ